MFGQIKLNYLDINNQVLNSVHIKITSQLDGLEKCHYHHPAEK